MGDHYLKPGSSADRDRESILHAPCLKASPKQGLRHAQLTRPRGNALRLAIERYRFPGHMFHWHRYRIFGCPPALKTTLDRLASHMPKFGPLTQRMGFTVDGDKVIRLLVVGLRCMSSPTAILRRVGTIVVDTVQRASAWTHSHVPEECPKAIEPFLANPDTSCTVVNETRTVWIETPSFHVTPRIIFFGVALPVHLVSLIRLVYPVRVAHDSLLSIRYYSTNATFTPTYNLAAITFTA